MRGVGSDPRAAPLRLGAQHVLIIEPVEAIRPAETLVSSVPVASFTSLAVESGKGLLHSMSPSSIFQCKDLSYPVVVVTWVHSVQLLKVNIDTVGAFPVNALVLRGAGIHHSTLDGISQSKQF